MLMFHESTNQSEEEEEQRSLALINALINMGTLRDLGVNELIFTQD